MHVHGPCALQGNPAYCQPLRLPPPSNVPLRPCALRFPLSPHHTPARKVPRSSGRSTAYARPGTGRFVALPDAAGWELRAGRQRRGESAVRARSCALALAAAVRTGVLAFAPGTAAAVGILSCNGDLQARRCRTRGSAMRREDTQRLHRRPHSMSRAMARRELRLRSAPLPHTLLRVPLRNGCTMRGSKARP